MIKESQLTSAALYFGLFFYFLKLYYSNQFSKFILEISTYTLIGLSALFIFCNINHFKLFYNPLLGMITFSTVYLGVILAGTKGLTSDSPLVIEGLSRIVIAVFAIWKLSADMRDLKLEINPSKYERSKFVDLFYGILYPPKELFRLLKVTVVIIISFYFILTGLHLISISEVNILFLQKTERLSLNVMFFGIQTPMMMASRSSVSKTFSEYLKNLEWAESAIYFNDRITSEPYERILSSNEISYDSISSNGKHLWLSVLLIIILQAFEKNILALNLFQINFAGLLSKFLQSLVNVLSSLF